MAILYRAMWPTGLTLMCLCAASVIAGQFGTPKGEEGTRTQQLMLDRRISPYSRFGDVFGTSCFVATCVIVVACIVRSLAARRARP